MPPINQTSERINNKDIKKMEELGLFEERKSSFPKAIEIVVSYCEKNKANFKKWMKSNKK